MKMLRSTENIRLYNEARWRAKTLLSNLNGTTKKTLQLTTRQNAQKIFRYINSKKHVRSGISPLKDSPRNFVTDDQNMMSMLNDYFSSVFNIPAETGHTITNDIMR